MPAQVVRPTEAYISVSGAIRCKEHSQSLPLPPKVKGVTGLGDLHAILLLLVSKVFLWAL